MKQILLTLLGVLAIAIVIAGIFAPEEQETQVVTERQVDVPVVQEQVDSLQEYSVLREWSPNGSGIGLEVLYKPTELTQDRVEALIKEIYSDKGKGLKIAKIYLSKEAWEEEQSQNYTDVYASDYLVYVLVRDGGVEIRWWQENGPLATLNGKVTELTF